MNFGTKTVVMLSSFVFCLIIIFSGVYFCVKPKIEINGEESIVIKLNDVYEEKGAKAFVLGKDVSNDIEIRGKVNNKIVGSYKVKYNISNKFINKDSSVVRTIEVIDDIGPEIKLTGGNVSFYVGDKYVEPGYIATDNYDGDITEDVVVTNTIDNNKIGKYEVVYLVSDSSDNKIEIKREVEVKEKPLVKSVSGDYGIPVLMYHFFYDESKGESGVDSNWMEISDFEEQLKYLDDNDYYFPTWNELALFVDGKISLPKKSIMITVDDGHSSFFDLAIPVINKYDVRVTSFIVTSWTPSSVMDKYRNDKIIFQTHTHNMHKGGCSGGHGGLFRCIDYNEGIEDLSKSVEVLGSREAIAYPFGDVTDNVINITKNVGITLGFTTKYGKVHDGMDKLRLPRVRMNKGISLNGFIKAIS